MKSGIIEKLKDSGLRMTPIRKELISLLENSGKPVSVRDILTKIRANKTTIYREIESLLTTGNLIEVDFADGTKRFELSSLSHHHHLICVKCHDVRDVIFAESLDLQESRISRINKFKVIKHNLEFFGYCQTCA